LSLSEAVHLPHDVKINDLTFDPSPIESGPESMVTITLSITNQGTNNEDVIWKLINKALSDKKLATGLSTLEVGETEIIEAKVSVKDFPVAENEIKAKINYSGEQESRKKKLTVTEAIPPHIVILRPAEPEGTEGDFYSIAARVTDASGVLFVQMFVDDVPFKDILHEPNRRNHQYKHVWHNDYCFGEHKVSFRACDKAGNCSTASKTIVQVLSKMYDTTPPF